VQKTAEECEKAEVRCWRFEVGREDENADPLHSTAIYMNVKRKELLEEQFVSD
jgi:hypothetical protein